MKTSTPTPLWRTSFFYIVLVAAVFGLVLRLFWLTVIEEPTFTADALENRVSRLSDPAARGIIYDSRGVPLVLNVPAFNVVIVPANLPDSEAQVERIYQRLSALLDIPLTVPGSEPQAPCTSGTGPTATRGVRDLVEEGAGFRPFDAVKIGCDVSKEIALIIREEKDQLPGVDVIVEPLRQYPTGELTAALIGYMASIPAPNDAPLTYAYLTGRGFVPGRDRYGVAGIEASMQDVLGGQNGSSLVEKDVSGQVLRVLGVETATVPGNNVQLTVDVRLQNAVYAAISHRIDYVNAFNANQERVKAFTGVAIVMNPNTGAILAMVSWPTYDNNKFARVFDNAYYTQLAGDPTLEVPLDPYHPLLNHAVNVLYPPGSVFKIVTAVGALEENVIDPDRVINDPGKITIRDQYFPADLGRARDFVCWKSDGHGPVDFITGIAQSCNVYFYKIGGGFAEDGIEGLGIIKLGQWMRRFGFGQPTNVELPGELAGYIPSPDRKRITWGESWSTGDTYNAVIGQGYVSVTPLQMLNAYNVVINGGWLYQPTIVDQILDGEGNVISHIEPTLLNPERLPISQRTLDYVRAGMRQVVVDGTLAGDLNIYGQVGVPVLDVPADLQVAGKTGTAEFCDDFAYPRGWCIPGEFPTHAWTTLYAPYEDPEVSVIVFVYQGGDGSRMAAPIAGEILRAYFELQAQDAASTGGN